VTIDETAPVIAKGQTEIAADGPTVWNVLTGIANWPTGIQT
jgi:hypothetical protein